MATFTWQNGVSGNWATAADWTQNGVPGSGDTVYIGTFGGIDASPWTVTVSNEAADALLFDPMGPAGTLAVSGLLAVGGAAALDSGTVELQPGATLASGGTLTLGVPGAPGSAAVVTLTTGDLIAAAVLGVDDGSTLDVSDGAVALGDATAAALTVTVGSNATLFGDTGTIDASVVNSGTMVVDAPVAGEAAGALTILGSLDNSAGITVASGAALAVYFGLIDDALVMMDSTSALAVLGDTKVAVGATFQIGAGDAVSVSGTLNIQGTVTAATGAYEIAVGVLAMADTGTFAVTDAAVTAGQFLLNGTVSVDGGSLTQTAATVDTIEGGSAVLSGGALWTTSNLLVGYNSEGNESAATLELSAATLAVGAELTLGTPTGAAAYFFDYSEGTAGTLEVDAGSSVTAGGLALTGGSPFSSTLVVAAGGDVVVGSAAAVSGAVVVGGGATLAASNGLIEANVVLDGALTEQSGAGGGIDVMTIDGSLTGAGTISVEDTSLPQPGDLPPIIEQSTLDLANAAGFTGDITLDSDSLLILEGTGTPTGMISVQSVANSAPLWSSDATVDLRTLTYEAFNLPQYHADTGLLVVGTATLNVGRAYEPGDFSAIKDFGTGTDVLIAPTPCFAAGTRIATPDGEVAVAALRPGDMVLTPDGPRPVRWVGRLTVDLDRHAAPEQAAPVRIRAHAVADRRPARDLRLSPDHAVLIDGVLMQAQSLVNGATILRESPRGRVTYFHVELDRHGILFAEGLPAESYLDTGNRASFAGEIGVRPLFPDLAAPRTWAADACAPLALHGPAVEAAHARLLRRALAMGHVLTADPALRVLADGTMVPVQAVAPGHWRARLPAGTRAVRLLSRGFVPVEQSPQAGDRRRLGLAVTALLLDGQPLPASARARGWHDAEPAWRWTDGDALLRLRPRPRRSTLDVHAAPAGPGYWVEPGLPARAKPRAAMAR
jgi:hypothetical protein